MTRIQLINRFLLKARALDAVEEEAYTDPKTTSLRRKAFNHMSIFDIHAMLTIASRGEGGSIDRTDMSIERRQFPKSAEYALANLRALAARGYVAETDGRNFELTETGVRFVNAVFG